MTNTSRYLLKSNGDKINADTLITYPAYTSGSYNYFTQNNEGVTGVVVNTGIERAYPIEVRNSCTLSGIMSLVTANATPTGGAKIGVVLYIETSTVGQLQVYKNLGEFDATLVGTLPATNVQTLSISETIPAGLYYVGISHSNASSISISGMNTRNLNNLGAFPVANNIQSVYVYDRSASYSYPKTISSLLTFVASSQTSCPMIKFRIA